MEASGTDAFYEISALMNADTAALLVVDVQEKLLPAIFEHQEVTRRCVQAIEVAGHLGLPILVTEQYVKGLGPTVLPVREALERFDAYAPIEKFAFSCFGEEKFEDVFDEKEVSTLVIVGIESHVCVMQTALDALDRDTNVYLIAEATGSRDARHKKEAVSRMRDQGAIIGSVEMLAFEAMGTARHEKFKRIQKVII